MLRPLLCLGLALATVALPLAALAADDANPMIEGGSWAEIQVDVIGDVALQDGSAMFAVEAPYRASDAATVPVVIRQTDPAVRIEKLTLVIDENPSPVAATISFGPAMAPLDFETRVRVNQYSNIRVLAETAGGVFMNGRYVKASGGCSAPATKDPEEAVAAMGQMKLRLFAPAPQQSTARREAQVMIRHPNYSGLQRDQVTHLFVPAHFISELEVWQGDEQLFRLDGGISISENPVFRFSYDDNGAPTLRIHAVDTEGNVFDRELPKDPPA